MSDNSTNEQYGGLKYFPSGVHVDACYRIPSTPLDQIGSPLIEALPPVREIYDIGLIIADASMPEYHEKHRQLPTADREQQVQCICDVFIPRLCDVKMARTLNTLIRDGYRARNPLSPKYLKDFANDIAKLRAARRSKMRLKTRSAALFGTPGMGKTGQVEHGLCLLPQVIRHPATLPDGRKFQLLPTIQIVYLFVRCPKNGSMLALCWAIIKAIDDLLEDTNHVREIPHRTSAEHLINVEIPVLIKKYHIGILVIDDIQYLNEAASGGGATMLNQFGLMEEVLKIPIFLVGTFASLLLFQGKQLGRSRKLVGFDGMLQGPMPFDEEWCEWCQKMWLYGYTKNKTVLSHKLLKMLHRQSAGIPDIAAKAYILAQIDAFDDGEEVTETLLKGIFETQLLFFRPFVKAVTTGDMEAIARAEDLLPTLDIREYIAEAMRKKRMQRREIKALGNAAVVPMKEIKFRAKKTESGESSHKEGLLAAIGVSRDRMAERAELLAKLGFRRSAAEFL